MFSLMGNCCQWMKKRREPPKKVTLVLIGLDNAGKTTTILGIQGEPLDDVSPTVGFSSSQFQFETFDVTVYDLGGGKKIRPIWKSYYAEVHGVVFMLDASDESRMHECQETLQDVLKQETISGKRILILANKQDKDGALDEIDICDQLNLEDMVNDSKSPCRVETCSTLHGNGKKMDSSVQTGLRWLLYGILKDWPTLTTRIDKEVTEQREAEAIEKKAKSERIRKRKEEREKKQEEERKRLGLEAPPSEDEDVIVGDPFKAVNKQYFDKKEAKKLKAKEKSKALALGKLNNEPGQNDQPNASCFDKDDRTAMGEHDSVEAPSHDHRAKNKTTPRDDLQQFVTSSEVIQQGEDGAGTGSSTQENPVTKKKRKKKKLKNNKLAPLPLDNSVEEATSPIPLPLWASTVPQRPLLKPPHQPTLDPLPEGVSPRLNPIESRTVCKCLQF